ncbi:putative small nuclear ribonucleoparticle-associated protein [Heterostelium album PN500]|uniref:Putative small nuclear ribonucleoparticle-associated protein n=1 Tax=Heterostelium pallidum (strain ATCC 26659 / Pp 5 / PN500) TaxID=670386 RepID=D3BSV6_HETP5|nr:putative small nuclear ribonucleoparticle-associated protein [Heterostelium album PN500]EFA75571.1 putative small nuclear ribonucleoparticle-associated protein [Heterostelium album PN500]|eukprot:XP_020427705.1 putative small nuclear ribonucleoparticle-associated protein [Heterostelium album PN500]
MVKGNKKSDLNSLLCVFNALTGSQITVQLRNENEIYGTIDTIDEHMNIELSNATLKRRDTTDSYDLILINSRNIRYIQIPDRIDLNSLLFLYSKTLSEMKNKYQRTRRKPVVQSTIDRGTIYVHDNGETLIVDTSKQNNNNNINNSNNSN